MVERYMNSKTRQKVLGRIGHRGLFLLLLGLFDVFYGLYLLIGGRLQFPLQLPNIAWGWIWVSIGAFLIAGAFVRRDAIFFAGAVLLKVAWALEFIWLAYNSDALQWPRAASWVLFAGIVLAVSAWPEPRTEMISEEAVNRAESVRNEEEV